MLAFVMLCMYAISPCARSGECAMVMVAYMAKHWTQIAKYSTSVCVCISAEALFDIRAIRRDLPLAAGN